MAFLSVVVSCLLCLLKADEVPPLPTDDLYNSYMGHPVCAYFKHTGCSADYEELLLRFLQSKFAIKQYKDWIIGSVDVMKLSQVTHPPNLYPTVVPSVQCEVGLSLPLEYIFRNKSYKSLNNWFKFVAKHRQQIQVVSLSNLENLILENGKGITIISFSGLEYSQYMETIYSQIKETPYGNQLKILINRPKSSNESDLQNLFGVKQYPTLLFFTYEVWIEKKTFAYILHGLQETRLQSIQLALQVIRLQGTLPDQHNVLNDILETKYQLPPKLVCVFSHLNPKSLMFVLRFQEVKEQLECEGVGLEFMLMNIGEGNNSRVFTRNVNSSSIKSFPVFLLFWQEVTDTYEMVTRQIVLDGIPSTCEIYSFLTDNKIWVKSSKAGNGGHCFSEEDEQSLQCVNPYFSRGICAANTSSSNTFITEYSSFVKHTSEKGKSYFSKSYGRRKKLGNLTVLSKDDWSGVIEASLAYSRKFHRHEDIVPSLNVVVFILQNCRYCQMVTPLLEKLRKYILDMDRAALYLFNCSSSPEICDRYNVRGYPSIKLFRSTPWPEVDGCLTKKYNRYYVVQDYHRPFEPYELILEWVSNSSLPVVRKDFLLGDVPHNLNHDVYLVGTVITRSHALQFMPPITNNIWYSFKCFQTVCELLFGKAVCFATFVKDFGVTAGMERTKNKDMFVTRVTLFRRDGIKSEIFELGVPIDATLKRDEDSDLHKFHNVHRYYLPDKFRCEDDHSLCTEYIVRYVSDHSRLPVTRLSHGGFHTVKRFFQDDNNELIGLPIVVVLVHQQNLTSNNSYFQEIMKAAYHLYRKVIFTALDVDEYPWWASRFVPKRLLKYFSSAEDMYTKLYNFPRVCIVMTTDHNKAAFYPRLKTLAEAEDISELLQSVNAQDLIQFVNQYLRHKTDLLVETKEF